MSAPPLKGSSYGLSASAQLNSVSKEEPAYSNVARAIVRHFDEVHCPPLECADVHDAWRASIP